jgi:hypothetical protein
MNKKIKLRGNGSCTLVRTKRQYTHTGWHELSEMIKKGTAKLKMGECIKCTLTDGTETEFVVVHETDTYIRFESRNFIGNVCWNDTGTNDGGYPASCIRKYMDETIWNLLPEDLRDVICPTDRKWKDNDGNIGTYSTKLFLPAAPEVFDEDSCYGDRGLYGQLEWYKNIKNRIRLNKDGDTSGWWLASVRSGSSTLACGVSIGGHADSWSASALLCVPVCFHIPKKLI